MNRSSHARPPEASGSPSPRQLAKRLAAYLPVTAVRQILTDTLPQPGELRWVQAATLFADLTGFTSMAEVLGEDGPRGAEELNRALLITFTGLINAIHDAGGAVSHFHGDAMMVYFSDTDGQAANRALACARFMQSLMTTSLAQIRIRRADNRIETFALTMRIGLSYGRCLETIVGRVDRSLEFVLAGTAVDEAVRAQLQAAAGQVVAAQPLLRAAGRPVQKPFAVIQDVPPVPGAQRLLNWDSFDQSALRRLLHIAPAFLHPALAARLQDPHFSSISEHRPTTSVFVRFSGIDFDTDEAGVQLQAYYEWATAVVSRFGAANARLNRVLMGDKGSQLHLIFGAPVAPDAPEQAIACALALQTERPSFIQTQQIGIAAGRVFACAVGAHSRREYTTVGTVVNLASRLTQVAGAGGILLDAQTARRVARQFALAQLPPVQLKGAAAPLSPYRVLGAAERPLLAQLLDAHPQTAVPFGRDVELAQLQRLADAALHGKGQLVALYGPFGSGQRALLANIAEQWRLANGRVFFSICQQAQRDAPFGGWHTIWRIFCGVSPEMEPDELTAALQAVAAKYGFEEEADVLTLAMLAGLTLAPREDPWPQITPQRAGQLVRRALAVAAAQQPILIMLEDIHWADQHALALIDYVAQALPQLPLLLLVTYRSSADFHFQSAQREVCTAVPLTDLSPQRARTLLQETLGVDDVPLLVEQRLGLRDRQGRSSPVNPLFLEEALRLMLAENMLRVVTDENGRRRLEVDEILLRQMQLPDTVYNLLLSRLDQLSAAARSLLQVAAVIGREFSLEMLQAVAPGVSPEEMERRLAEMIDAGMIQPQPAVTEPTFLFQHALAHDVVYQSLAYARRQALHAAIAEHIVHKQRPHLKLYYPVLAYHYSQTEQHEEGLQYALAAADDAAARYAHKAAAQLYGLAIQHLQALGEQGYRETAVRIYVAQADVLRLMGVFTKATLSATEALKRCLIAGDIARTLPVYNLLASIRYHQARYEAVIALSAKVISNLGDYTPPAEMAQAYLLSGMASAAMFDLDLALDQLGRAEEICLARRDQVRLTAVWSAMAGVYGERLQFSAALPIIKQTAAVARRHAQPEAIALTQFQASRVWLQAGDADKAQACINAAITQAELVSQNWLAHMLIHRAALHEYNGRYDLAEADLTQAIGLLETMDDALGLLQAYLLWGYEVSAGARDWQTARRCLVQVGQLVASQPEDSRMYVQEAARLWLGLGVVALHMSGWEQAESLFLKALRAIEQRHLHWWRPAALYYLGLVHQQRPERQRETAVSLFKRALAAVSSGGCPDDKPRILLRLALLADSDSERMQLLEQCVAAAVARTRFIDRLTCFRIAGKELARSDDVRQRQIGHTCLAWVARVTSAGSPTVPLPDETLPE